MINRQILLEGTIFYVLVQLPAAQRARPRLLLQDKWCYQKANSTILSWTQTWPCNQLWVGQGNQQPPYTSHRNWPLSWPEQFQKNFLQVRYSAGMQFWTLFFKATACEKSVPAAVFWEGSPIMFPGPFWTWILRQVEAITCCRFQVPSQA